MAWPAFALVVLVMAAGRYYEYTALGPPPHGWISDSIMGVAFMAFPAVGALVASRRSRNAFGWLLLGVGAMAATLVAASGYAAYAIGIGRDVTPLSTLAAWIANWLWLPLIATLPTFLFLLFPTGKLPSPRWRWVARATAVVMALVTVPSMLQSRLSGDDYSIDNPIGVGFIEDAEKQLDALFVLLFPVLILSVLSLGFRYRRASTEERQQLKWVGLAAAVFAVGLVLGDVLELAEVLFPILLLCLPVSIAVAILKYRLYDIDLIINRALVYGALSALLAATYLALVVVLQGVIPAAGDSDLTIAGSTLAVAALFGPLRSRVQGFIDRRFYRRKVDAQSTLESFTARLRNEVDLDQLSSSLVGVVRETMQPEHASLWLRPEAWR